MSSIKLKHSGGNSVSISAPTSNPSSDLTLLLPSNANSTIDTLNRAGNILQVQHNFNAATGGGFATSSTSYVTDAALPTASITPTLATSKVMIIAYIGMQHDNSGQVENTIYRIISGGATTDLSGGNTYGLVFKGGTNPEWGYAGVQFVDSPSTTSQVTYTWYSRSEGGQTVTPRHTASSIGIQLFEIAA